MKKLYYFLSIIIFAAVTLVTNPANAQNRPAPSPHAPINSGIIYLAIAGVIIGVVALRKFKGAKA